MKKGWQYPNLDSAIRLVAQSEDLPVPVFTSLPELMEKDEFPAPLVASSDDDSCSDFEEPSNGLQLFNQGELNDLVQDLCLSKEQSDHGIISFFNLSLVECPIGTRAFILPLCKRTIFKLALELSIKSEGQVTFY